MTHAAALVVFFSRSGHTREVAQAIARRIDAPIEELLDPTPRGGVLGYARCSRDATLARAPAIAPLGHDLSRYELVIVGTPVWNASPSAPVRAFFARERARLPRVAFFLTHGGFAARRVFATMTALAGQRPIATLAVRRRHFERGEVDARVRGFAGVLSRATSSADA